MSDTGVPQIRDMTEQCKNCGDYHFPDNINKEGLCTKCASGKVKPKPAKDVANLFDGW